MYQPSGVKTSPAFPIPDRMKAWVLGDPDQLLLLEKPVPIPARAEVLVRIDAVAICATDLEIIHSGSPASIQGGLPFNRNFTPGHEYMGTVAALGPDVDEFKIGERISVEIHAGCGQCKRCRQGMYTSCLNYGKPEKGHRANGFTTDGGFAEYAINHINTLARVPDTMSDAEATLIVSRHLRARLDVGDRAVRHELAVGRPPTRVIARADERTRRYDQLGRSAQPIMRGRNSVPTDLVTTNVTKDAVEIVSNSPAVSARTMLSNARATRLRSIRPFICYQSRRQNLPRGVSARSDHDGSRPSGEEHIYAYGIPRRRPQRHAPRR